MHHNMEKNSQPIVLSKKQESLSLRYLMLSFSTTIMLISLLWIQNIWAEDKNINEDPLIQKETAEFIQKLADKALTNLRQKETPIAEQEDRFRDILAEGFDSKYIGKISLGRHTKDATSEDVTTYYTIFPDYLVKVYTSRLTKLDTKEVIVGEVLPNGKKDMYVRTKVIDGENKSFDVDWRVRPYPKNNEPVSYKIIDVKIEGISMARTQRDDFTSKISESGVTGLISFMKDIIAGTIDPEEGNALKTAPLNNNP
ncbi:MAG: ABC transporter substrate-binding protein [Emcibacter sp.]|nr:ABC transporter substrate-binding protein [Emcibacter sp.]